MSLNVIKIPQTVEQTCQSHGLPTKESVGIIHVQHFWKRDRQTVQVPKQAAGQPTSKRQAVFFARRDYFMASDSSERRPFVGQGGYGACQHHLERGPGCAPEQSLSTGPGQIRLCSKT